MVMKRKWGLAASLLVIAVMTSGCMYQGEIERQQENPAYVREELARVQGAIDQYFQARGVYPIKNSSPETPVYEKYVIDFRKLAQSGMLSGIPRNAFEQGGRFYYVLVEPETNPKVKLMDLVVFRQAADLQQAVDAYVSASGGKLPLGIELAQGFYSVDFDELGEKVVQVQSFYSGAYLPFVLSASGTVGIDYGLDIVQAARQSGRTEFAEDADVRALLVEAYPFVPVKSFPYRWANGEPKLSEF